MKVNQGASTARKAYFAERRKIQVEHDCSFPEAKRLRKQQIKNGTPGVVTANGASNGDANGAVESPVQRKLKAARTLIAECGGSTAAAAEFMEIMEALG